jgi:transketolase
MAIADRMDRKDNDRRIYCLMSDGELEEGETREAAMLAGKNALHNLVALIERNGIQIDGFTEDVVPLEPLADKWRAFHWHVIEIDGHDMAEIAAAFDEAEAIFEKPTMIIAHTIPGKGVHEFERVVPRMMMICPCDAIEAPAELIEYFRMGSDAIVAAVHDVISG